MYVPRWIVYVVAFIFILNSIDAARSLYTEIQEGLAAEETP